LCCIYQDTIKLSICKRLAVDFNLNKTIRFRLIHPHALNVFLEALQLWLNVRAMPAAPLIGTGNYQPTVYRVDFNAGNHTGQSTPHGGRVLIG